MVKPTPEPINNLDDLETFSPAKAKAKSKAKPKAKAKPRAKKKVKKEPKKKRVFKKKIPLPEEEFVKAVRKSLRSDRPSKGMTTVRTPVRGMRTCREEKQRRIVQIFNRILEGGRKSEVVKEAQAAFNISERTAYTLYYAAAEEYESLATVNRAREMGKAIVRYEDLFSKAYAAKDWKLAASLVDKAVDLLGLRKIEVEVNQKVTFQSSIGDDGIIRSGFIEAEKKSVTDYIDAEVARSGGDTEDSEAS